MAPKRGDSWFVRIHRTYEELEPWVQNLTNKCEKLVVYEHEADEEVNRLHCHLMIVGYKTSDETMKVQVTKTLGHRPEKTDWAWDPDIRSEEETITYMTKRDLQAKYVKGVSAEMIAECSAKYLPRSEYGKRHGKTQFKVIAEKPEVSKKRQNDLLDEMVKRLKGFRKYEIEQYPIVSTLAAEVAEQEFKWNANQVLEVIMSVLNEERVIAGRYKIRDYYDTLMMRLDRSQFKASMIGMLGFKNTLI